MGRKLLVLVAVAALLTAACGKEKSLAQHLTVTAKDYGYQGLPETITGGTVNLTFRNKGQVDHEIAAVDIGDTDFATFRKGFPAVLQGKPWPSWMNKGGVPAEIKPGETTTTSFTLPAGKYMFFCALPTQPNTDKEGKPHYELGMHQNVTVDGEAGSAIATPGGQFTAKDYTFVPPAALKTGKHKFSFKNVGPNQWHFMNVNLFPKGMTAAAAEAAFVKLLSAPQGAPPPKGIPQPTGVADTGAFSPGLGGTFEMTLLPGRTYLLACFLSDKAGGPPHAIAHHMIKAFTVPA